MVARLHLLSTRLLKDQLARLSREYLNATVCSEDQALSFRQRLQAATI
jgi:hypothetical protein